MLGHGSVLALALLAIPLGTADRRGGVGQPSNFRQRDRVAWSLQQQNTSSAPRRLSCSDPLTVTPDSDFRVVECADVRGPHGEFLPEKKVRALHKHGFTKCISVHEVLFVGTDDVSSDAMLQAASNMGHLLDTNCDGEVDLLHVHDELNSFRSGTAPVMTFARSVEEERDVSQRFARHIGYQYGSFSYFMYKDCEIWENMHQTFVEEAFHMVHLEVWAKAFSLLGDRWESLVCEAAKEAQCNWYVHPQNYGCLKLDGTHCANPFSESPDKDHLTAGTAPGTCAGQHDSSTCANPSCDCAEWFHKVYMLLLEEPASYVYQWTFDNVDLPEWREALSSTNDYRNHGLTRAHVKELLKRGPAGAELLSYLESGCLPLPQEAFSMRGYQCLTAPTSYTPWAPATSCYNVSASAPSSTATKLVGKVGPTSVAARILAWGLAHAAILFLY